MQGMTEVRKAHQKLLEDGKVRTAGASTEEVLQDINRLNAERAEAELELEAFERKHVDILNSHKAHKDKVKKATSEVRPLIVYYLWANDAIDPDDPDNAGVINDVSPEDLNLPPAVTFQAKDEVFYDREVAFRFCLQHDQQALTLNEAIFEDHVLNAATRSGAKYKPVIPYPAQYTRTIDMRLEHDRALLKTARDYEPEPQEKPETSSGDDAESANDPPF